MVGPALAGEWRRAQECLGAAALCRDSGYHADAVSRAYYAILHAAKAVLPEGVRADSHRGVLNQFGLFFVREGLVESVWSDLIRNSQDERHRADYDVTSTFTETDSLQAVENAASFLSRIRLLLGDAVP